MQRCSGLRAGRYFRVIVKKKGRLVRLFFLFEGRLIVCGDPSRRIGGLPDCRRLPSLTTVCGGPFILTKIGLF